MILILILHPNVITVYIDRNEQCICVGQQDMLKEQQL